MKSLMEALMASFIAGLVLLLATNIASTLTTVTANTIADDSATQVANILANELPYQLRTASRVIPSYTRNNVTFTSDADTLVLGAPAYNASQAGYFLDGIEDVVIFDYNAQNKTVVETIVPGTGSARPSRTAMVVSKNVESVSFTYQCRERLTATTTGSSATFTLAATPVANSVRAYHNGASQTVTVSGANITISGSSLGKVYQVVYRPSALTWTTTTGQGNNAVTTNHTAGVSTISFTITGRSSGSRQMARTYQSTGVARLRNYRK